MDRRRKGRKFLVSTFLRCLEYSSDRDILTNFYAYEKKAIGYETIRTSGQSTPSAARLATMVFVENMRAGKEPVADQYDFVTARALRKLAQAGVKEVKVLDAGWDARRLENLVFPEDIRDPKTNALLAHRYEFVKVNALNQLAQAGIPELEALDVAWDGGVMLETMRADPTHSQEEALKDIYHRLRPGDPVTASNAQQLVRRLFFDDRRYDLGKVGRYKLNLKLRDFRDPTRQEPPELPPELRVLDKSDIIAALRLLAAVNTTAKQPKGGDRIPQWRQATTVDIDDIDHLGSRRIRTAGELLENQCRIGLARTDRTIHERMTMAGSQNADNESEMLRPTRLVNSKTFGAVVNEFFARSQLSQFMDQTNPLSGLAHKRRLSALGPGTAPASRCATCTPRTTAASARSRRPRARTSASSPRSASTPRSTSTASSRRPTARSSTRRTAPRTSRTRSSTCPPTRRSASSSRRPTPASTRRTTSSTRRSASATTASSRRRPTAASSSWT